jgi:hypothetical protein
VSKYPPPPHSCDPGVRFRDAPRTSTAKIGDVGASVVALTAMQMGTYDCVSSSGDAGGASTCSTQGGADSCS